MKNRTLGHLFSIMIETIIPSLYYNNLYYHILYIFCISNLYNKIQLLKLPILNSLDYFLLVGVVSVVAAETRVMILFLDG